MITRRGLTAGAVLLSLGAARVPLAAQPIARLGEAWWRERHEAKLREAHAGPFGLVWLGDSITQNWEKTGPAPLQVFRPVWDQFYGDRHPLNLGFGGDATSHLLWRLRNGEIDGIAPRVAIILIGANNLGRLHWPAADTLIGIDAVIQTTRQRLPRTSIVLLSVLPSRRNAWATVTTGEINRGLAARYGGGGVADVTYLDVTSVFAPGGVFDAALFYDPSLSPPQAPLHPTAQAQARLAAFIEPTVARLMGDRDHRT